MDTSASFDWTTEFETDCNNETELATDWETDPATDFETELATDWEAEIELATDWETEPATDCETEFATDWEAEIELATDWETEPAIDFETELAIDWEAETNFEFEIEFLISANLDIEFAIDVETDAFLEFDIEAAFDIATFFEFDIEACCETRKAEKEIDLEMAIDLLADTSAEDLDVETPLTDGVKEGDWDAPGDLLGLCFVKLFQSTHSCVNFSSFWAFVWASVTELPCATRSKTRFSYFSDSSCCLLVPKISFCTESEFFKSTPLFLSSVLTLFIKSSDLPPSMRGSMIDPIMVSILSSATLFFFSVS